MEEANHLELEYIFILYVVFIQSLPDPYFLSPPFIRVRFTQYEFCVSDVKHGVDWWGFLLKNICNSFGF